MDAGRVALEFVLLAAACLMAWPSGASAQTLDLNGPPPPPTLRGVAPAGSTLHVTWDPVAVDDLAGYRVGYRLARPNGLAGTGDYSFREVVTGTTFALTGGIDNGTPYEVVVRAVDTSGAESELSAPGQGTPRAFWLSTGQNIQRLRERDAAAAGFVFNTPFSFTLSKAIDESATQDPRQFNPRYAAGPTLTYASYAKFAADVEHDLRPAIDTEGERRIKSWVQAVLYDPEAWVLTPEPEQADPNRYMEQFCRLAHDNAIRRLTCINLPSVDLGIRFKEGREDKNDAYLRMGFAKAAARTADITGIQSQLLGYDLEEFERLVREVAQQARAADANPNVSVIAEVTPVNNRRLLNLNELFSAYASVRTNVAGMYLALPFDRGSEDAVQDARRERRMDDFLNQVQATPFPDPPDTRIDAEPAITFNTASLAAFSSPNHGNTGFQCQVDRGAYAPCAPPFTTPGLGDGPHRVAVRSIDPGGLLDGSGLIDARPDSRTFTLENFVPETTIDAGPAGPTNDSTPTFRFSADEPAKGFSCRIDSPLDETAFVPCSTPLTTQPLAEGPHTLEVRATDMVDKTDLSPARRDFTVDLTAPDTFAAVPPSGLTSDTTPSFSLSSTEEGVAYQCRVDSTAVVDFLPCESTATMAELEDGAHVFEARAVDAATNVDASPLRVDFTVDATAPITRFTAKPARVTRSTAARFAFTAKDASAPNGRGLVRECRLDRAAWASCVSPVAFSALKPGLHSFRVRARDLAGNVDPVGTVRTWRVQTEPATLVEGPALWELPVRPSRAGLFTVPDTLATCARGRGCSVSVTIRPSTTGRRRPAVGARSATIAPAAIAPVRALLSKTGLSTLKRSGELLVRADISVRDGKKRPVRRTVRFTLVAPRR